MKKYNWVAQDEDGCIYLYDKKPEHSDMGKWWRAGIPNSDLSKILRGARITNWKDSLIDLSKNDYIVKDGILMATRKHAALIHAWADGAVIQYKFVGEWVTCADDEVPEFCAKDIELRIKPKTKVVRFRNYDAGSGDIGVAYSSLGDTSAIKWVGDWQTAEVEIEL